MKEGWTYKKLGEVCKVIMGQSPDGESVNDTNGIEFHQGKVFFGEKYLKVSNSFTEQPSKIAEPNSVLLCVRAPVGVVNLTLRRICIGRGLCAIQPNDNIIMPFIYYALTTKQAYFDKNSTGSTFKAISSKIVTNTVIPVPPIGEQERIVAELDLLSGIIEKKKEQLKAYDQLAQSIFYSMFGDPIDNPKGWETKRIGDFASCIAGATPSTLVKRYWEGGDIPWLSSGEVAQGRIYDTEKKITSEGYNNSSTKLIPPHTVVIALAGQGKTRGTVGVAEISLCTNQSICSILTNGTIDNDYLYYQLKYMYAEIRSVSNGEGGRGGLNLKIVSSFKVIVPPLSLQQEFAEKIEAIERQKALVQQSIEETQTMFDYTMDKYFG